ncbi:hypothetical protein SUVZ_09G0460 [Saccharomyces uvarum]|uniref:Secreted protein n=1 Tax=Saccharomyces uvarum TaxID=230603 RepID=A0ABN8X0G7_SACUV|nr:hypothetical protein SUVZ_09G0460 [Saccharomyces uvarum]
MLPPPLCHPRLSKSTLPCLFMLSPTHAGPTSLPSPPMHPPTIVCRVNSYFGVSSFVPPETSFDTKSHDARFPDSDMLPDLGMLRFGVSRQPRNTFRSTSG